MRTVFFGTPELAVPALRALARSTDIVGVVSQPDRPAGRGLELNVPAVKRVALDLGLDVHQPVKVKTGNLDEWLRAREPDVAVVLAYGRILPPAVLAAPRHGCMNLHASLLPRYRGAAPIQWAIIRGETETGISLMQMDEGLDTGPVFSVRKTPLGPDDDAATLGARLSELAAEVVELDLPEAVAGIVHAVPQNNDAATFAPPLTREHGRITWDATARAVVDLVRGLAPRPGATTTVGGRTLKLLVARRGPSGTRTHAPGTVVQADRGGVLVQAGDGLVEIVKGQLEGKKAVTGSDLANGRVVAVGLALGG
ncbi:MAG TPA: methionyl-tRNA formyltransferase [Polyangiaceae bacterium]|nr:methionyl-tRNA formyltransferase [Polyangiaceae bacterium]